MNGTATARERAMDSLTAAMVVPVATFVALLYLVVAIAYGLLVPPGLSRSILVPMYLASCLLGTLIALRWPRLPLLRRPDIAIGTIGTLLVVNIVVQFAINPVPRLTGNFITVAVLLAAIVSDTRWFVSLLSASLLSWCIGLWVFAPPGVTEWIWRYILGLSVACGLFIWRRRQIDWLVGREARLADQNERLRALVRAPEFARVDLTGLLRNICTAASEALAVERVGVWRIEDDGTRIRCLAARGSGPVGSSAEGSAIERADAVGYFDVLRSGEAFQADDVTREPALVELARVYLEPLGIGAMLDVPIIVDGRTAGVICHEHVGGPRHWSIEDRTFATALADVAALAISTADRADLERRQRELERAESLGVLAGGVAHDFNNLLTVILGQVELLQHDRTPAGSASGLAAIRAASERARELAHQLLAYAGRAALTRSRIDPAVLLAGIDQQLGRELADPAAFRLAEPGRSLPELEIDVTQIRQVVMNLIVNARDAGARSITLGLELARLAPPFGPEFMIVDGVAAGAYVAIEVKDDGCGMDEETRRHMFDPFFTTRADGTGMGLAAVLGILRAHAGTVSVLSAPAAGTTVRVFLPVAESMQNLRAPSQDADPDPIDGPACVILVEDHALVRSATRSLLVALGAVVHEFAGMGDLEGGLDRIDLGGIDLALVDLALGDGDGREVRRRLLRRRPDLPVVFMRGYDAVDAGSPSAAEADVAFLQKPFMLADLRATLARARASVAS